QPEGVRGVGGHLVPVARGEGESHDRRAVGRGAALELLHEEAAAVAAQPVDELRPGELALEGDLGQAQHLLRGAAAHDHVPEEEVLQDVGANAVLALLEQLALVAYGQQLRRHGRVPDVVQGGGELRVLAGVRYVLHDGADHGLGEAGVYVVVGDLVAVVGAPAVGLLGEVLRADVEAVHLVGDVEQHHRALAGLGVLEDDAVVVKVVAYGLEVLFDALADGDYPQLRAQALGYGDGVVLGAVRRAEAGHGDGD